MTGEEGTGRLIGQGRQQRPSACERLRLIWIRPAWQEIDG